MGFRIVIVFALVCGFSVFTMGQSNISGDEYLQEYIETLTRSRAASGRHQERTEWYTAGRVIERWTSILETDALGNTRFRHEAKRGVKRTFLETIKIGEVEYCRENLGKWKVSNECGTGVSLRSVSGNTTETYTKQDAILAGVKTKLLVAYTKIEELDSNGKATGKIAFNENKVWISGENLILKREYISGTVPKKLEHAVFENYEYNTKIPMILAPIK